MLGNSIKYAERVEESRQVEKIKKVLVDQASEFIPSYYAVLYYGKDFLGGLLEPEEYRKRWDREEVIKTHSFISRQIRKCFGDIPLFWFINRHDDYEDTESVCKKGSFHSDLYIGEIPDEAIEDPSTALLPLFYAEDQSGIPINMREVEIEALKQLLLELCIREARWIGKHPNSLKLQKVPIEEFEQTFDYGLKDIIKLDDFNQADDWEKVLFIKQLINHLALLFKYQ